MDANIEYFKSLTTEQLHDAWEEYKQWISVQNGDSPNYKTTYLQEFRESQKGNPNVIYEMINGLLYAIAFRYEEKTVKDRVIFKAEVYDEEGRNVSYQRFFTSFHLAKEYIMSQKWFGCVKEVKVFDSLQEKGEKFYGRSWEVDYLKEKQKNDKLEKDKLIESARSKVKNILTVEERKALGL